MPGGASAPLSSLPALGSTKPTQQMVPVTPADLDAALQKDKEIE